MTNRELLDALNDSQRAAVEYCDGPELVIAGAGSGKTRVLTYKIAYLLQGGMAPWNILALTFTNKAANEMKARIATLLGQESARQLYMGTFHSIFSRILRIEAEHIGYNASFTIYDESDSRSLIKTICKDMKLDDKIYKPASIHNRISMAKNRLILPAQYADDADTFARDKQNRIPETHKIYTAYQQRLQKANAMDFDDLLVLTYMLFRDHQEIRAKYAERFRYVLVDEYQDTNFAQQQIVKQLTQEHRRLCVVGDDYQSIYAFRGANIDNMLNFQHIYPEVKLFKLEQNYRSTQRIVEAANSLMKHNERQIPKDVYSKNDEGEKISIKSTSSDKVEAALVCNEIKRLKHKENCDYSDFAVLYRTNAQSRSIEEEMSKQHIPCRIVGGQSFYQRKEIKDIIAYFRLIVNPDDEEALKRIINYPARGIGNTTIQKISLCAQANQVSLWQVVSSPVHYQLDVNSGTIGKLEKFRTAIQEFMEKLPNTDAFELGQDVIRKSGIYQDLISDKSIEGLTRIENLDEFLNGLSQFVEEQKEEDRGDEIYLPDFLQTVSLLSDLDTADDAEGKVTLMTIHAAKGLEFPTVFVVGLEEGIFPSLMASNSIRELEEERRLLYVAITRAKRHCMITWSKLRWRYGKMEYEVPSRFLNDINPNLTSLEDETGMDMKRSKPRSFFKDDYEIEKPYTGSSVWGSEYRQLNGSMQNSRPVAGQFMADPVPKITTPKRAEEAVDPLSGSFKRKLAADGGSLDKVNSAIANGGRRLRSVAPVQSSGPSSGGPASPLKEGNVIEHQRFGIGKVLKIEGTGENTKATVEFENTGTKQLILKFAKYTIIS